jgi:hypothetical protein
MAVSAHTLRNNALMNAEQYLVDQCSTRMIPGTVAAHHHVADTLRVLHDANRPVNYLAKHWWHHFDGRQFQAARVLLDMPREFDECSSGVRNWHTDAFFHVPPETVDKMNGGQVAEHLLAWRLMFLRGIKD